MPSISTRDTGCGSAAHGFSVSRKSASARSASGLASRSARKRSGSTALLRCVIEPGMQYAHGRVSPPRQEPRGVDQLTALLLHLVGSQESLVEKPEQVPGHECRPVRVQEQGTAAMCPLDDAPGVHAVGTPVGHLSYVGKAGTEL